MKIIDIVSRANKNLTRSKSRTILTIIAIIIGAFTMALTTALGEGVKKTVDVQVSSIAVGNSIIVQGKQEGMDNNPAGGKPAKYNPKAEASTGMVLLDQSDIEKIKVVKGAESISAFSNVSAEYITSDKTTDKYVIQMSQILDGFKIEIIAGKYPSNEDNGYIVLTEKYVAALGYANRNDAIGKMVKVVYLNPLGKELIREYKIQAIVNNSFINGGSSYISRQEGITIAEFQTKDTPMYNKYGAAVVMVSDKASKDELNKIRDEISNLGYTAQTLDDQISMIKGVITVVQLVIGVFGALTVVASIFGIVNTMLMSVFERTKEIGLMKAVGMSRKTVFAIFALEAGSIGFWGGIGGLGLARLVGQLLNNYLMASNFLGFEGMEFFIFPIQQMLYIVLALTLVGLLSGVLPAMKASSLDPIEALRHE
jgi:putative ABC transport system permease protein